MTEKYAHASHLPHRLSAHRRCTNRPFNWLFARHNGGQFVLRIEDTDQIRSTDESTKAILDAMSWLGLTWDEGPHFQAQRVDLHREMVQKLLQEGKAYYCTCTPEELEAKRKRLWPRVKTEIRRHLPRQNLKTPGSVVRFAARKPA